ncbi:MAG: hypothetical protein WC069_05170 [Candidatus Shapirobacteria bacterium]
MKKYLVMSFLLLLTATPALAKGSVGTQGQQGQQTMVVTNKPSTSPTNKPILTSTGNQVKNENQVKIQNQGEEKELSVKTQEQEVKKIDESVTQSFTKVSDQVKQLVETTGAKGGIGTKVKEIAQSQTKLQDQIKLDLGEINSRGVLTKLMIGSDKKMISSMEQKMEQNRVMIQQLEELKLQTKNTGDVEQLQETIDLMTYQNTSLQNKVEKENKTNGLFGWFVNFFNQ